MGLWNDTDVQVHGGWIGDGQPPFIPPSKGDLVRCAIEVPTGARRNTHATETALVRVESARYTGRENYGKQA